MKHSVAIMAHPFRRKFVDQLFLTLDEPATVIWDRHNDRWETGRRALLAYNPECSHHLVIQDDAIPCQDFVAGAMRAAAIAGERPVSFYIGRTRPHRQTVSPAVERALKLGHTWLAHEGPWWGVAVAFPTAHIEAMVEWGDGRPDIENYDKRLARWYWHENIECWYTLPSLVDHRPVDENPSLIKGRIGNRRAHEFIGVNRSALDVTWDGEATKMEDLVAA